MLVTRALASPTAARGANTYKARNDRNQQSWQAPKIENVRERLPFRSHASSGTSLNDRHSRGVTGYRLAIEHKVDREFAQCRRDGDDLLRAGSAVRPDRE
jgi:hypothetical protein